MKAAKAQGAVISFDLVRPSPLSLPPTAAAGQPDSLRGFASQNYRAKLWATMGGLEKAQEVGGQIAELCDVIVGNEEDLQLGLGVKGADVEKESKLDPVSQRHPAHCFSAVLRRFPAVLLRCPASWRRDGDNGRKMAENGRNLGEKRARNSGG